MNKEDINRPETEDDDDGGRHMTGRVIQNFQFAARARGLNLGPMSANKILEMADKGELKGMEESVKMVRGLVAKIGSKSFTPANTSPSYRPLSAQEKHDQENEDLVLVKLVQKK